MKKEKLEKLLLLYMVFRNEFKLKCKRENKIPSEKQIHEYALEALKENYI